MVERSGLRLMHVHAHPDDESSKGAASTARYVAEGVDVHVVTCTGGERGSVLNPKMDRPEVQANITEGSHENDEGNRNDSGDAGDGVARNARSAIAPSASGPMGRDNE